MKSQGRDYRLIRIMIVVAVIWGMTACIWTFTPFQNPSRHSEDFLLSVDTFPGEWTAERYEDLQLPGEWMNFEASEANQGYINTSNPFSNVHHIHAGHYITAFASYRLAHQEYASDVESWFSTDYTGREWTAVELKGNSFHADEYQQGCAIFKTTSSMYDEDTEVCVLIARYGQYVTFFRVAKDLSRLTYADVDMLFAEIDKNFSQ